MERITGGPGVGVNSSSFGSSGDHHIVRAKRAGVIFDHPWLATLQSESEVSFRPGFVNTLPATIKGVPLAGDDENDPPVLAMPKIRWNIDGLAWLCVEVTCRDPKVATSKLAAWALLKAEMVQVADPDEARAGDTPNRFKVGGARPLPGFRARWPVAMLQQGSDGVELFQITHFNLTHRVGLAADGVSAARHFFY